MAIVAECLRSSEDPEFKLQYYQNFWTGGVAQVVEHLPSNPEFTRMRSLLFYTLMKGRQLSLCVEQKES
jgi:hypothetical protein